MLKIFLKFKQISFIMIVIYERKDFNMSKSKSKLYYENRIALLESRAGRDNQNIIKKLKRQLKKCIK